MATKPKPKRDKPHRPKTITLNPLNYFIGGLKKVDPEMLVEIHCKNHESIRSIMTGTGTVEQYTQMTSFINMALILEVEHFDGTYRKLIEAGHAAGHAVGCRYLKLNKFVFRAHELAAINNTIIIHEAQMEMLRIIDIERAYDIIKERDRTGKGVLKLFPVV